MYLYILITRLVSTVNASSLYYQSQHANIMLDILYIQQLRIHIEWGIVTGWQLNILHVATGYFIFHIRH